MGTLSAAVGHFNITASGNASVTGLDFQPKFVMFYGYRSGLNADAESNYAGAGFGCAVSSSSRWCLFHTKRGDGLGTGSTRRMNNNRCYLSCDRSTGAVENEVDFVSMNSDGFTYNVVTFTSSRTAGWWAIGGSAVQNVALLERTAPTSTGNEAVSGLGFQPTLLLFADAYMDGTLPAEANDGGLLALGMTDGTNQFAVARVADAFNGGSAGYQRSDRCMLGFKDFSLPTVDHEASITSLDSNGYTLNWNVVNLTVSVQYFVAALRIDKAKVLIDTQRTSSGTKATTGSGFTPKTALFLSGEHTGGTSTYTPGAFLLGATGDTAGEERSLWHESEHDPGDATGATSSVSYLDGDKALVFRDPGTGGGTTSTLSAEADVQSFDSNGFTLNWTTADATAREFGALLLGEGQDLTVSAIEHVIGQDF